MFFIKLKIEFKTKDVHGSVVSVKTQSTRKNVLTNGVCDVNAHVNMKVGQHLYCSLIIVL